jgi:hypothetical protein
MSVSEFFSASYQEARKKFLDAGRVADTDISSHCLPMHKDQNGLGLFIDVASRRAEKQRSLLVVISGTHGVEGFCGSGCQVGLLRDQVYRELPNTVGLVLVHALNPYGFAYMRRVNEDNVDLNRNFHDFSKPFPSSAAYEVVHNALVPLDWDGPFRLSADAEIQKYIQVHGSTAFQAAVSGGQYSRPDGLFFGGTRQTWSNNTFCKIMSQLLTAPTEKIAILDLHTGLGPSGYGEPIYPGNDLAEYLRAIKWFGPEVTSTIKGDSTSAQVTGSLVDATHNFAANIQCTFLAIEYGTIPVMQVLTALRADNWLHANAHQHQAKKAEIKKQILDAFYVDQPWWKAAVYGRSVDMCLRAGRGLG